MSIDSPRVRHRRRAGAALAATAALGTSMLIGLPAAQAAPQSLVVNSLGLGGNANAGVCEAIAGAADCTLRGALEIANESTNPDGVAITFDAALSGSGELSLTGGAVNSMHTSAVGDTSSSIGPNGARFLIDSEVPVSIDFTNLDGITDIDGSQAAGFYIVSDGVQLSNLANLRAAEGGIAIAGTGTQIRNVELKDPDSPIQEIGIALLDGASNTTISDVVIFSAWWASIVVDSGATVTNTTVTGLESRGVENAAHFYFYDGATVDNFNVAESTLGNPGEASPSHGFYFRPNTTLDNLTVRDSVIQSPNQNALFFLGSGQTFTGTTIVDNTIGGNDGARISRVIGNNTADWTGLVFNGNDVSHAQAIVFGGTVTNADFIGNTIANIEDAAFAAFQLGANSTNVRVADNSFDHIWALDTVRVEGTSAQNVVIEDNEFTNLTASVSRSAVRIATTGSDNVVRNNTFTQDLNDGTLPATVDNHWAVYNSANASSADALVGWTIQNNHIDGFGGRDRSQAPITHAAVGKLTVIGNTFGVNTRGGTEPNVENGENWFLRNALTSRSNNTVQTYRATEVAFTGSEARFTATSPEVLPTNNAATTPVTLYVYWTAAEHAEEYLGVITDVTPGQRVSVPTTRTDGFIRVQTVDANGYTSQYSSIDETPPTVIVEEVVVDEVTEEEVTGAGRPGASVIVRDLAGETVAESTVDPQGRWTIGISALECGTSFEISQIVDGVESAPIEFTTLACDDEGNDDGNGLGDGDGDGDGNGTGPGNGNGDDGADTDRPGGVDNPRPGNGLADSGAPGNTWALLMGAVLLLGLGGTAMFWRRAGADAE